MVVIHGGVLALRLAAEKVNLAFGGLCMVGVDCVFHRQAFDNHPHVAKPPESVELIFMNC